MKTNLPKSKRLAIVIIVYGFLGWILMQAIKADMENLAITCATAVGAVGAFYLKYETQRPSEK